MPSSISGGIVSQIDNANFTNIGTKTYLDEAPEGTVPPYITYNDNVSMVPEISGDAETLFFGRQLQFNLWQLSDDEDPSLVRDLLVLLDGMRVKVDNHPFTAVLKATSVTRIEEPLDTGLTHHEITVSIAHTAQML